MQQYHFFFFFFRFYVDNTPIRVFKNNRNIGVDYPNQAMKVEASIWNGDSWATDGGQTKIDWTSSPFTAHFRGFGFGGCLSSTSYINEQDCYDPYKYWWNQSKYWKLNHVQQNSYEHVRQNFMNYDYCNDRNRHPTPPIECAFNI